MQELMKQFEGTAYPDMIRGLPEVELPFEGVRGWLLQGGKQQICFFDIQAVGEVPPHSHCAQWGIMLEGEMSLTIGDETRKMRKGDWYFIPEGVVHSAKFHSRVNVIDMFDAPDRYQVKS